MRTIRRNPNARIFNKSNTTDFQLPLLASKEDIQQQSGIVDLNGSTDYDYNKFFLDLLNNEELKQIADSQDKRTFIKYIIIRMNFLILQFSEYVQETGVLLHMRFL
ncbi:hypothetical protein [Streptococcus porcinus]|uniref:Uncharacterized protein n=2 Tax=Streptococcus porcinus TaxID=1340 RepID=A0A4V0H143_STRPO|nr:hypothetical protein [Streptococcus porcinus]EGJ27155.1 hypothetical protein STRPO_1739 [Streptococcus porcinus str. Jelinkova 176]MBA2796152.1 hypothetical protein [Streptococcus porcinus]SQG42861.1 Uncharacterised protein [Streptococcus porcinus]VTT41865.1 Uncharacterised protein [Streptococcus porcinus]VTT43142.1 Uncharacterised protein [Streptococcus porcinus]